MNRNPITDPRVGDELVGLNGKRAVISTVTSDRVFWYLYDKDSTLICAFDCDLIRWRMATSVVYEQVDENRFLEVATAQSADD